MIQAKQTERVRLPSVNDIFPSSHNYNYKQPVYSNYSPEVIVQCPVPISTNNHFNGPLFITTSSSDSHYHPNISPIKNHAPPPPHPSTPLGLPPSPVSLYGDHGPSMQHYYVPQPHHGYPVHQGHYNMEGYKVHKKAVTRQSNAWSYEDDCLLKYLKEVRNLGWREISMHFKNRTANGCQFRWRRISSLSKGSAPEKVKSPKIYENKERANSLERILN